MIKTDQARRRIGVDTPLMAGPAPWPLSGSPRILVEDADEQEGLGLVSSLGEAGYDVALCPGPGAGTDGHHRTCPLVEGDTCPVVDGADVIVSALGFTNRERRDVVDTLRLRRRSKPLVLLVSPPDFGWLPELGEGCAALVRPVRPPEVTAAVAETLRAPAHLA